MALQFKSAALLACALVLGLGGCASAPPPAARLGLKLPPAELGATIAVQQHLRVERNGRSDELDVAMEIDPQRIELVGLALGQRVLSLSYDGKQLQTWRHVMLPSQVRAEDVLEDVQLTLWPAESIRAALPAGWRVEDQGLRRTVTLEGEPVMVIDYASMPRWSGTVVLENLRYRYRLTIQFEPSGEGQQ